MPTMIGHHHISKGKDHWLVSPKREEIFGPLGVSNIRTFVDPAHPARVAVLMDVADLDALMAGLQSSAAADAMEHDGVVADSLVMLVEESGDSRSLRAESREPSRGTMETITIFARMSVAPEHIDDIKSLAEQACRAVADEPGTLIYDWHYSDEHGSLVVLERYADSAAHIAHMQAEGHGAMMGSLMALIGSIEFHVLGEPTAEHAEMLSAVPGSAFYVELASA